jgi:hypothetical protein
VAIGLPSEKTVKWTSLTVAARNRTYRKLGRCTKVSEKNDSPTPVVFPIIPETSLRLPHELSTEPFWNKTQKKTLIHCESAVFLLFGGRGDSNASGLCKSMKKHVTSTSIFIIPVQIYNNFVRK